MKKIIFFSVYSFLTVLIVLNLVSCTAAVQSVKPGEGHIIPGVPFYPQEAFQCGPASLASVLNYRGVKITPDEIASEIFSKSARGTLDFDLVLYAQKKGLRTRQYRGSIADLRRNIESGNPVIVLVDYGFLVYQINHFMVVVGYTKDGIIVNSGSGRMKFMPLEEFMTPWDRAKNWSLLIE
ncbi:MAG: C39 family peptidase [Syntrophales bacterium]